MLVPKQDFYKFIEKCADEGLGDFNQVIMPRRKDEESEGQFWEPYSEEGIPVLTSFRTHDPLRVLFYFARERVFPFDRKPERRLIIGAKACDLRAMHLLDRALINDDFVDPAYKAWRENTYIISSDCEEVTETCHCTLMDGKPYVEEGFDLNISTYEDNYYVEADSGKGEELLDMVEEFCISRDSTDAVRNRIQKNRGRIVQRLEEINKNYDYGAGYERMRQVAVDRWLDSQDKCVGCGACTNICPTCYCLILNDESRDADFIKVRSTDSCQLDGYASVAGGDSPRPKMRDRFRNRYLCKFDYMDRNFSEFGCVGCGRCIDACPAEIDLREVVSTILASPIKTAE